MTFLSFPRQLASLAAVTAMIAASPGSAADATRSAAQRADAVHAANRAATIEPSQGDFVNGAAVFAYAEGALYRVYTAPGRVTDIALQAGEALVSVASGDTVRWVIGDTTSGSGAGRRVHVLVKPFSAGLSTNLVVTTDRRTYHLSLSSSAGPAMAALSWTYPQDALLALDRTGTPTQTATPLAAGLEIEKLNFAYRITGDDPSWKPLRAFDDGRQTYIEFPASLAVGEAPPLFLVDREGKASLVNYRVQGRFYIVDRLFDRAELRLGAKRQDVVRIVRGTDGRRRS
ncbi:P-type conjugative transfer protein TrbG [Tsuneonella deserti]|uniref:P-type conjugative transfer protein TrbG n=1 Tax=Tsuneonella deserti TaxID=2035528 RepID=A0ABQ1SEA7_9SPHN|nr:P-type conjugative transfer protein TrbG [Tsuneonella deserti]GGE05895.1 P-type conjugative transfer protein TrbG [Tsuneonella deserti]